MITAFGNPVYDYIKTPKVDTETRVLSGCSTNAVLALARLGERTRLVGSVGDDYRESFVSDMHRFHIEPVITPSKTSGGFSLIYYDAFGNRTLDLISRAADISGVAPELYRDAKAVLIGPILGELSFDSIREIRSNFDGLFFCDPQGLLRGVNGSGRITHEKKPGIEKLISLFDVVKPNELEANVLTGIDCRTDPYEAARIIKAWGPKIVIVTLAELGSIIYDGDQFIDIPPYEVDLVDATGAGDTYMAGFTFEYLRTGDLRTAGCFASCTSSIVIEHVGPEFPLTEAAVRERQKKLLSLSDFHPAVAVNR
jgi:sugar/nucleoside kinase (ribokinase family)